MASADLAYKAAVDPPDPKYTQRVTPQIPRMPAIEALAPGLARDMAETSLAYLVYVRSASTARDRAGRGGPGGRRASAASPAR